MKQLTEKELIEANIRLHNYLTGKEWRYSHEFDDEHWITTDTIGELMRVDNHLEDNFYFLWQVLQKIETDKTTQGLIYSDPESQLYKLNYEINDLIAYKKDPIDIFWATNEFLIELNKHLKK